MVAFRIIASVYSPAFLQPIWILDYRLTPLRGKNFKAEFGRPVLVLPREKYDERDDYLRDQEHRLDNRLHELGYNDRLPERSRSSGKDDEGPQVIELNRLRQLARDGRRQHRISKNKENQKTHGYNPGWAPLPDIEFAGRNKY